MDSVNLLTPFQMFAGLSPDELRLVAWTAQEVELMSTFVCPTSIEGSSALVVEGGEDQYLSTRWARPAGRS